MIKYFCMLLLLYYHVDSTFVEQIIHGTNKYVEFYTGNIALIISVPHGGSLQPISISNRTDDTAGNIRAGSNTIEIAKVIRNTLKRVLSKLNRVPFMVVNNLHRIKMDPNKKSELCCKSKNETSNKAYTDYHSFISKSFHQNFMKKNRLKRGLLIDIQGHLSSDNWIEINYLLTSNYLNNNKQLKEKEKSSICNLASNSTYTFENLVRGKVSLGNLLETRLMPIKVIPSLSNIRPNKKPYQNNSVFIIETYGSKSCNETNLNAMQLQLPAFMRSNSNYERYAHNIALAIFDYYKLHFN